MLKQTLIFPLVFCATSFGCAQMQAPAPSISQSNTKTAQVFVNGITGNSAGARQEAYALRHQSDVQLAAKDYKGAIDKRLQMLSIRGNDPSTFGFLTAYAIQDLALSDLPIVASHLDAPSCRKYASQLMALDARSPSYAAMLRFQKAVELKRFATLTRDPQVWQKGISGDDLGLKPQEQETLKKTPVAQIRANIENIYNTRIREASNPFSQKRTQIPLDPYTRHFAAPSRRERFLWTNSKTERLLVIAALQKRARQQGRRTTGGQMPIDPFGNGPLEEKKGLIYSIGPDGKDDGGKSVSGAASKRPDYQGDIPAPSF